LIDGYTQILNALALAVFGVEDNRGDFTAFVLDGIVVAFIITASPFTIPHRQVSFQHPSSTELAKTHDLTITSPRASQHSD
jgi:hypothetical protein